MFGLVGAVRAGVRSVTQQAAQAGRSVVPRGTQGLSGARSLGNSVAGYDPVLGADHPDSRMNSKGIDARLEELDRGPIRLDKPALDTANEVYSYRRKIEIVNTTKRDGDQSNSDCRMSPEHVQGLTDREINVINQILYPGGTPVIVGEESRLGGNTFRADACVNGVNPYHEANLVRQQLVAGVGDEFESRILFRGQCGAALSIMAKDVIAAHVKELAENGVTEMKVFWALNYTPDGNLPDSDYYAWAIQCAKDNGMKVEFAIAFHDSLSLKQVSSIAEHGLALGADSLSIKDMGALISPNKMYAWAVALSQFGVRVGLHTHNVTHMGSDALKMGVFGGATRVDTAWSAYGGGNGQPAFESVMTSLGLDDLMMPANQSLTELNDYIRAVVMRDLASVQSSGWACDWRVIDAGLASGAIAHVVSMLSEGGKSYLFKYVYDRVAFVREDSGNPPLVTPTALYNTNQVLADLMQFEAKVKQVLTAEGLRDTDAAYAEKVDRLMMQMVKTEPSPKLTVPMAGLYRGDFGKTPAEQNPDTKAKVLKNYVMATLEGFPFEKITDEIKDRICEGVLACDDLIRTSIRDQKGITYDDYLLIKKGLVTDEALLGYIKQVPILTDLFNEGSMSLSLFKQTLPQGLTTIGNCSDWMPDGMPAAQKIVDEKLESGWTLPPNTSYNQMVVLVAKFGEGVYKFFEHHADRSQFELPAQKPAEVAAASKVSDASSSNTKTGVVLAPMKGSVLDVLVAPGDYVDEGQEIMVLTAMKMESIILAPKSGTIKSVHVEVDQVVNTKTVLVEFE